MSKTVRRHLSIVMIMIAALMGCRSPYAADQGALLGGLGGAGIGALIGADRDQEVAGAALGSAVGALTGAVAGTAIDNQRARQQQAIAAAAVPPRRGGVTVGEVVQMTRAGLSYEVISSHLQSYGVASDITTAELIHMKNLGVTDPVLHTMQQLAAAPPVAVAPAIAPVPTVVEQHVIASPVLVRPRRIGYCPPPHRRRASRGLSWGVSFSN